MKKRVLIISIFVVTTSIFGYEVSEPKVQMTQEIQQTDHKVQMKESLVKDGLEENSAIAIVEKADEGYYNSINEESIKITKIFPSVKEAKIRGFISKRNLKGDYPDLKTYGSKIQLLQNIYKIALLKSDLEKISSIC